MKVEFQRYQLPSMRILTGSLQILASLALLFGFKYPFMALLGALLLSLMMFFAMIVRIRIKDPYWAMIPAFVYMVLNLYIITKTLKPFLEAISALRA